MEEETLPTVKVFYSYAHEDKLLRDELDKHLGNLKRRGLISSWNDRDISAGKEWKREIDINLDASDIILILVSPDFMHSDYCYSFEMKLALEKHHAGKARAIPIILRPVDWEDAPFSQIQALPTQGIPVTTWLNRDEAFLDIVKGIRKVVKEIQVEKCLYLIQQLNTKKEYKQALAVCENAIHVFNNVHELYFWKYIILSNNGDTDEALMACQQAIDIAPHEMNYREHKALYLKRLGRYKEALIAYQEAINLQPDSSDNWENYFEKGEIYLYLENYEEALEAYKQSINCASDYAYAFQGMGNVLFRMERYEEALAAYQIAIDQYKDEANFEFDKGNVLFKLKRYEEALIAYQQAIMTAEEGFQFDLDKYYQSKANTLFKLERYKEAIVAYQSAIDAIHQAKSMYPTKELKDLDKYYQGKADTLFKLECYEEAIDAYRQSIKINPDNSLLYASVGDSYIQLGRFYHKEAERLGFLSKEFNIARIKEFSKQKKWEDNVSPD